MPEEHAVKEDELLQLDRYMLARTRDLTLKVLRWYDSMEFHRVYHAVNEFCITELSALYLDALKDRMYTFATTSRERRSAQTALWRITEALVRLVAPVLSFTSDEVWDYLPAVAGREASVHLARFVEPAQLAAIEVEASWVPLFVLRDEVLRALEEARKAKQIGKSLEAKVLVHAPNAEFAILQAHSESLKELFNVSQVELKQSDALRIEVTGADGAKCGRCWNYRTDIAPYGPWPEVCGRCAQALDAMHYSRQTGERAGQQGTHA